MERGPRLSSHGTVRNVESSFGTKGENVERIFKVPKSHSTGNRHTLNLSIYLDLILEVPTCLRK